MYVWKNVSKRDRRTRPVAPAELHLTKQTSYLAVVEGRAARERREQEQQRDQFKEEEAHEVELFGRDVKSIMLRYLETDYGKVELERVVAALRAEQDLAEALSKRREVEAQAEVLKHEAEDHALGEAHAARKGDRVERERKAILFREKLRRQGLLVEEDVSIAPKDEGWWDLLLTQRKRGFFLRRKFIKAVMSFTDCKWTSAAKLVDRLPAHVVRRVRPGQAERFRRELEKIGGICALERGEEKEPETQYDRNITFLENQKKQRASEKLRLQATANAADELQDKELQRVMDTFMAFDADGSGEIDVEELGALLKALCVPIRNQKELDDLMEDMDDDGSGDIDFDEFYSWYMENAKKKQGGFLGKLAMMAMQASNAGQAAAGGIQRGEATRIICACAEEDATRYARLKFRQSRPRPLGADEDEVREAEEFRNAEKRFSCVRSVVGRPTISGGGHDEHGDFAISDTPEYEARRLRANRLMFHPVLWPTPPPVPKDIPPLWMNAAAPSLADPLQSMRDAEVMGATVQGVDPCKGFRTAPRRLTGLATIGASKFVKGRKTEKVPGTIISLADALSALRKDIATLNDDVVQSVFIVERGTNCAQVLLRWRPELKPRPQVKVGVEGEFSGWDLVQLQPSKTLYGAYDAIVPLPPGSYAYQFQVDGEYHLDPAAPRRGDPPLNIVHVVAEHGETPSMNLDIRLDGHGLRDDGAWALAGALRAGGGGGALQKLSLASNEMSGDGCGAICATFERGDAPGLTYLDLSRNRIGRDGGHAIGKAFMVERKAALSDAPTSFPTVPAPLIKCVLARCALADDGTAQVAMGLIGHSTLKRLGLNENAIGEYGSAALGRALLRNGVLTHLSLAANKIDVKGCEHLSEPVRLSGTLLHLELNDNPRMGSLGAWWLGEALAGGSAELRDQVASDRAARKRGEDPNRGGLTLKALAIAGVGSDEESGGEEPSQKVGNDDRSAALGMRLGASLKAKAAHAKTRAEQKLAGIRQGALEHLGLGDCQLTGDGTDLLGINAICDACERTKRLTSLDLANNGLTDECVRSLANALERSKPTPIKSMVLRGNNRVDPKWLWRDHAMPASEADAECAKTSAVTGKHVNYVPSIATTLAQSLKDRINEERERKGRKRARKQAELDLLWKAIQPPKETDEERVRREDRGSSENLRASRGSSMNDKKQARRASAREKSELRAKERDYRLLKSELDEGVSDDERGPDLWAILPPPKASEDTRKLEGEWTQAGWLDQPDKNAARLSRRQGRDRVNEAARTRDEDDAVTAAGAAAAAKANLAAARLPDGVRLARAVADEMAVDRKAKVAKAKEAKKRKALEARMSADALSVASASEVSARLAAHLERIAAAKKRNSRWCCARKHEESARVKPRKSKDKESWKAFRKRRKRSGSGDDVYRPRGSLDELGDPRRRLQDPVGDAAKAKAAAQVEKDHLDSVAREPSLKETKAEEKQKAEEDWLRDTFQRVDMDHGGTVDAHELSALLVRLGWAHFTREQMAEVYAELDEDNSGEIDVEELILWWRSGGKERVRRERLRPRALLRRVLAKPKLLIFGPPKGARGGMEDPRVQDGVRCLEADAASDAQRTAREMFRRRRPPRDDATCVCAVCGLSLVDLTQLTLHTRDAKREHRRFERARVAEKNRRKMLERARVVVANELRAREGRKAEKAAKKFGRKSETDAISKRKKKGAAKDAPPFPVLLCFDAKMPHHAEVQTYDMPDAFHGRPTGAVGLKTCGIYCVADGLGNPLVTHNSGTEWLRVVWPSSCIGGGGPKSAVAAADTIRRALAAQVGGAPLPPDPRLAPRPLVWLRNRHPQYLQGKRAVFVPLRAGETPYEFGRTPEEMKLMKLNEQEHRAALEKRTWYSKQILLWKKERIRRQQEKDEAEEVKRKMIMGGNIDFACLPRTLVKGREVELFGRPRWFRAHPALPKFAKLKVRVVPEIQAHVVGELFWGHAILAYGKAGHWLLVAFEGRDNAWILAKAPTRAFLQQVTSTVELGDLEDGIVSPQQVEAGACEKVEGEAQRTVADEIQSLAMLAEQTDVSDAELAALGDARHEKPTPLAIDDEPSIAASIAASATASLADTRATGGTPPPGTSG